KCAKMRVFYAKNASFCAIFSYFLVIITLMTQPASTENQPPKPPSYDVTRKGEYARQGDFHKNLNPNWSYYPIYVNKIALVDELLQAFGNPAERTLDAGCGEGVLVEKYAHAGWDIIGLDKNYASQHVKEGSLTAMPFETDAFGNVLCL